MTLKSYTDTTFGLLTKIGGAISLVMTVFGFAVEFLRYIEHRVKERRNRVKPMSPRDPSRDSFSNAKTTGVADHGVVDVDPKEENASVDRRRP